VQAYRRAAETILGLEAPIQDMMACQGRKGLRQLPGIGAKLSQKIEEILTDVASNLPRVVS
jgi:DNA polymerase/3'-5' exonuclease PolX